MDEQLWSIDIPFVFRRRSTPLSADLRPAWRIGIVLLALLNSRGRTASLQKLHVLNSAMRSQTIRDAFTRQIVRGGTSVSLPLRIEPSLNRAVALAQAEGLIQVENGARLRLTALGENQARRLQAYEGCFETEKAFLADVGKASTEEAVEAALSWGLRV